MINSFIEERDIYIEDFPYLQKRSSFRTLSSENCGFDTRLKMTTAPSTRTFLQGKTRNYVSERTATHLSSNNHDFRACGSCRTRKVRCDVNQIGLDYTSCRLDQVKCLVFNRKGEKWATKAKMKSFPRRIKTYRSAPKHSKSSEKTASTLNAFLDLTIRNQNLADDTVQNADRALPTSMYLICFVSGHSTLTGGS